VKIKALVEELLQCESRHVASVRIREDSGLLALAHAVMQVIWPSVELIVAALPQGRTYMIGVDRKSLSRIHFSLAFPGRQLYLGGPGSSGGEEASGLGPGSEAEACRAALQKTLRAAEELAIIDRRTPLTLEAAKAYVSSKGGDFEQTLKVLGLLSRRPLEVDLGTSKTVVGGQDDLPYSFPSGSQKQVVCNVLALREDGRYLIGGEGGGWPFDARRKVASADSAPVGTVLGMAKVFACRVRCVAREVLHAGGRESSVQVEAVQFEEALDVEVVKMALRSAQFEIDFEGVKPVTETTAAKAHETGRTDLPVRPSR
jgi:hypothetical protein